TGCDNFNVWLARGPAALGNSNPNSEIEGLKENDICKETNARLCIQVVELPDQKQGRCGPPRGPQIPQPLTPTFPCTLATQTKSQSNTRRTWIRRVRLMGLRPQ